MIKKIALLAFVALAFIAPAAIADDITDIGYFDQSALGSLPAFASANQQLAAYQATLNPQYAAEIKAARSDADKQRITITFQQKFSDKQREVIGPLFERAQLAIAQVSSSKDLSVVVDKRIVIFGGQDITKAVMDLLQGSQAIAPPAATPAPSQVGFVDQTVLDALPKVKTANQQFATFADQQRTLYQQKFAQAKTDTDKQQVAQQYNKTLSDEQDQLLKPLVDQTRSVTSDVAKKKGLILVIDRADILYGGTDITKDVQDALSK